jgi:hypothetical protein
MTDKTPTVFVSYAWEDDVKIWVRELATLLRTKGGIDAKLDQWELAPGDPLPAFMEQAIEKNDFVLVICTPKYKSKSDERQGGVGYEGHIITAELFDKGRHRKFIPILLKGDKGDAIPRWLQGKKYLDFRGDQIDRAYEDLLRAVHGELDSPPTVGQKPVFRADGGAPSGASFKSLPVPPPAVQTPLPTTPRPLSALAAPPGMDDARGRSATPRRTVAWALGLGTILAVAVTAAWRLLAEPAAVPERDPQTCACDEKPDCSICNSGRDHVPGACADPIPSSRMYRLRLAGVSLFDRTTAKKFLPGPAESVCVQQPSSAPVCAKVSDAMSSPVLGLARIDTLVNEPGIHVRFSHAGQPQFQLPGMRVDRKNTFLSNRALCYGAALYSEDGSQVVRFFLDDP